MMAQIKGKLLAALPLLVLFPLFFSILNRPLLFDDLAFNLTDPTSTLTTTLDITVSTVGTTVTSTIVTAANDTSTASAANQTISSQTTDQTATTEITSETSADPTISGETGTQNTTISNSTSSGTGGGVSAESATTANETSTDSANSTSATSSGTDQAVSAQQNATSAETSGTGSSAMASSGSTSSGGSIDAGSPSSLAFSGNAGGGYIPPETPSLQSGTQLPLSIPEPLIANGSSVGSINQGQGIILIDSGAAGGTPPYRYQWLASYNGGELSAPLGKQFCGDSAQSTTCYILTNSSTPIGDYTFKIEVTDSSPTPLTVIDDGIHLTVSNGNQKTTTTSTSTTSTTSTTTSTTSTSTSTSTTTSIPQLAVSISPNGKTVVVNGTVIFTNTTSGGVAPYTYSYNNFQNKDGVLQSGNSFTFTVVGNYLVTLTAQDSEHPHPQTASSGSSIVVTPKTLTASASPNTRTADQGQAITLTASAGGGLAPFSYQWYNDSTGTPVAIGGATSDTLSENAGATGTFSYYVVITDSYSERAKSNSAAVTVNPTLSAGSIAPGSPAVDSGQSITFTANPSGGTPAYSYQWYSGNPCNKAVAGATSSTYSPSPKNNDDYCVAVSDSASVPSSQTSPGAEVKVNKPPKVAASPKSDKSIDLGEDIQISASASDGTGQFSYAWTAAGSCPGFSDPGDIASFVYAPTGATSNCVFDVSVTDTGTDAAAYPAATASDSTGTIAVNSALKTPSITPSSATIDEGQSVLLSASTDNGGSKQYTYQWQVNGADAGGNSNTFLFEGNDSTLGSSPDSVTVTIYDSGSSHGALHSKSYTSLPTLISVSPALDVSASTNTSLVLSGDSIEIDANVEGGTAPYAYQWYNDTGGAQEAISGATSSSLSFVAGSTGNFLYSLVATDSSYSPLSASTQNVLVSVYPASITTAGNTISSCFSLTPSTKVSLNFQNMNSLLTFGTSSAHTSGCFTVSNVTGASLPSAGSNFGLLEALNISFTKTAGTTLLVKGALPYNCSIAAGDLGVYAYTGGSWTAVPFAVNQAACSVSFTLTEDPTIGLFIHSSNGGFSGGLVPTPPTPAPSAPAATTSEGGSQAPGSAPPLPATTVAPASLPAPAPSPSLAVTAPAAAPAAAPGASLLGSVGISGMGLFRLRKRLHRAPYGKNRHAGLAKIEEIGIIDVIVLAASMLFFVYGFYLESALDAFGFGVALTYLADTALSWRHKRKMAFERKEDGLGRLIEELGIFEAFVLAIAIYAFISGHPVISVVLSGLFGVVFTTMVDKAKLRHEILITNVATA